MRWQNKMKILIENVLNYGLNKQRYFFYTRGDSIFVLMELTMEGEVEIGRVETSDDLANHWRRHARTFIMQIIDGRINEQFKNNLHAV